MIRVHPSLPLLPIRRAALDWLRDWGVRIEVVDPSMDYGGGYWDPDRKLVYLYTSQAEAAIHEIAHAWWHPRRLLDGGADMLIEAVVWLANEYAAQRLEEGYRRAGELAYVYVHGDGQGWPGLLVERNDWEMYAGLASGVMGNTAALPDYVARFYVDLLGDETDWGEWLLPGLAVVAVGAVVLGR